MKSDSRPATNPPQTSARPQHDHVSRLIEQWFDVRTGELIVGGVPVSQLANEFGTPAYLYDRGVIDRRIEQVKSILPPRFQLYYSVKANPNAALLRHFVDRECGLEIASRGELHQAINAGCPTERVIFAGPGKTREELEASLGASIRELHVESVDEARCINAIVKANGQTASVALRVNPVGTSGGAMRMGGYPSPFGIDEETLDAAIELIERLPNIEIAGVHLFMGTQILDAAVLLGQYEKAVAIARHVASRTARPLKTIDFGGGLGTPYFPHEAELDLKMVAAGLAKIGDQMRTDPLTAAAEGILEPGRYLVNEAGIYLTQVTRVKESRDKKFVVINGGMHQHLAASGNLGQTIKRNYPLTIANNLRAAATEVVDVVGPLCTPLDTIARQIELPRAKAGDLLCVFQSGAYARTSSPLGFLSHEAPPEILVANGRAEPIRRRGEPEDFLRDQRTAELPDNLSTDTPP